MANIDLTSVEEALRAMKAVITINHSGYEIMPTCGTGSKGTSSYDRFIMFTHKIKNKSTNKIVCYITYRSKLPTKEDAPTFSSYEIFDGDYHHLTKIHIDYADGTSGKNTFKDVCKYLDTILI